MNTTNHNLLKLYKQYFLLAFALLFSIVAWSQDPTVPQDSTSTGFSFGNMQMPNPTSIESKYTYDPITDRYIYTETVGSFNINYPIILTSEEYEELVINESIQSYYKKQIDAFDGKKEGSEENEEIWACY